MKNIFLSLSLLSVTLLSGCDHINNTTMEDSGMPPMANDAMVPGMMSPEFEAIDVREAVTSKYWDDKNFQQCMGDMVDACIGRVIYVNDTKDADDIVTCDDLLRKSSRESCKLNLINQLVTQDQDVKWCEKITEKAQQTTCRVEFFRNQAVTKKDITVCDELGDADSVKRCKERVADQLLYETADEKYCQYRPEERQATCKEELARIKESREMMQQGLSPEMMQRGIPPEMAMPPTVESEVVAPSATK